MGEPNMEVLKPSRKKLRPGDIFVMKYPKVGYLFGRVAYVDLAPEKAPMPGCGLIYIYRSRSSTPDPTGEDLSRDNLLVPPVFINRLPWSRGYFQTVDRRPLRTADILDRHCFDNTMFGRISFLDEDGVELDEPFEPCGVWGMHSYASLDDDVSDALGVARAPV